VARFWSLTDPLDKFLEGSKIDYLTEPQINQLLNFLYGEDYLNAFDKHGQKYADKYAKRKNTEKITALELSEFLNRLLNQK
jgi:hypothetical protein